MLGVKTHQLNKKYDYDFLDKEMNQLAYFNQTGLFDKDIGYPGFKLKSYPITDDSVDLEKRIRSYLDVKCASCHQDGGIPEIDLDFQ